ncbi:Methicillin resistance regulatory protein MecI [Sinobacterium norvegicum]|uniref:Methicillin resistance regulatory protein MecI n=1 Tax=Sinobacterium norvegicum TaxID=1641715 RepID=A0ABM9AFJ6_9GAMM|nr:BlaI/MecI/CopY family transcriptional regulator [Sinobacterium norvegicum]CAH0991750.1 Methicillin resistance regulatory protein MecI [Sinobacterium norvegicum]
MSLQPLPELSKSEHEIMQVLWLAEKFSIREVHDQLDNGWAYSTTKTVMDRMVKKGLLERGNFHGVFLYRAMISRPTGMAKIVRYFAEKVLKVEYPSVVSMFAQKGDLTAAEIDELSQLIENDIKSGS